MDYSEIIEGSLRHLATHKLRTALTMLGMIFGVAAVIAMLSIGAGGERQAMESIEKLGIDNVIIRAREIDPDERAEIRKKSLGVSLRDAEAIEEAIDGVELVLPKVRIDPWSVIAHGGKAEPDVLGLSHRYADIASVPIGEGRFFDQLDESTHAQVAVIGSRVRRELFGPRPAIGELLKVNDVWLEVIGVMAADVSGGSRVEGLPAETSSNEIWIPLTTAMRKFDRDPLDAPVDELLVKLADGISPQDRAEVIRPLLERLHAGADDFEIIVPEALLEQSRRTRRIFNIVMGSIAGISLLVGGIGIMNIMLASVLERTREIGLRRAIGATRRDIRRQFVIESFTISILGGLTGIVVGILLAWLVAAYAGWPTVIEPSSVLVSTVVSMTVGLVSGIYPATRAASLDPIEALRYE